MDFSSTPFLGGERAPLWKCQKHAVVSLAFLIFMPRADMLRAVMEGIMLYEYCNSLPLQYGLLALANQREVLPQQVALPAQKYGAKCLLIS